jgi:hypothetical protein
MEGQGTNRLERCWSKAAKFQLEKNELKGYIMVARIKDVLYT